MTSEKLAKTEDPWSGCTSTVEANPHIVASTFRSMNKESRRHCVEHCRLGSEKPTVLY